MDINQPVTTAFDKVTILINALKVVQEELDGADICSECVAEAMVTLQANETEIRETLVGLGQGIMAARKT